MIVMLQLFVSDFRTLLTGKTTKHIKQLLCLAHIYSGVLSEDNFMLKLQIQASTSMALPGRCH